jgi:uncharacterized RDD family membrane protein YckC
MKTANASYDAILIETPENIAFTYELAGPGTRMMAYMIDFLIGALVMGSFNIVMANMINTSRDPDFSAFLTVLLGVMNLLLIFLGGFNLLFEFFMNGQTPGKAAFGIRVIQDNGAAASFQSLVARNVFRLIDCNLPFQYFIGAAALTFSAKCQRFGDMMGGTIVVKERNEMSAAKYRWRVAPSRSAFRKDVNLSRHEFDHLMEYVELFRGFTLMERNRISTKLAALISLRHSLHKHPDFAPLVTELHSQENLKENPPHKRAEAIFRLLMEYYVTQQNKGG